ncbi:MULTISPECIES: hypothetical protein [unclassified Granulicatella]|uniref:hypothetical protein n=1 Tax=unclassified Granulicatella TaxID=2630493 RepID=UPI00107468B5|nr:MULTISPECIES: hypothetical protein [unclassified Granulicatella]MBF0780133.1 hypothetical protein [Granulicatella sp. 19428wC4_WM01]TFU95799.1 hypothetical protein E4T68_03400 [Granulicatella sp. WM01]
MGKKCKKTVITTDDVVLVDGYYMPKMIVEPYKRMRAACIFEMSRCFEEKGYSVATIVEELGMSMHVKHEERVMYRIDLSPQHVSHIDKLLGTNRLMAYLDTFKED